MFKKVLFLAALSGALIGTGAITTSASAAIVGASNPTEIFDISSLDAAHQALVLDALDEFDYDWSQMAPALKKKTGKTHIPIRIVNIAARWNACGLSWPNGVLEIDDQVLDPIWFQQVVQHEVGHMVDFFHLRPARLHGKIAKIYGAPWKVMGHNFNNGFIQVFSTIPAEDASYPMTEAQLLQLRTLLGGNSQLPDKDDPIEVITTARDA